MLRTRLWMGMLLVVLSAGLLLIDRAPWYPFLFVMLLGLSLAACYELVHLVVPARRPASWLCLAAVALVIAANWPAHFPGMCGTPWLWLAGTFSGLMVAVFLVEMANFREPGGVLVRMALVLWIAGYLGFVPSFIAPLRWLDWNYPAPG